MEETCSAYGLMDRSDEAIANLESNIVSVIQAGAFFGAVLSTWVANRFGRRPSLIGSAVLVLIGVALQAGAHGHLEAIYIGR